MIIVNAIGEPCPIPVVKTKKVLKGISGKETVEVLVDNEIAVQNLSKMAKQMGYEVNSEQKSVKEYRVIIEISDKDNDESNVGNAKINMSEMVCSPAVNNKVVVIRSSTMGSGNEELGKVLMKGFIYALSQMEDLPKTMLFYNGGARLTCEGSDSIEDLENLEARGVEILTCGTCLNYYGLAEKLQVGQVTNMYAIVEKMSSASFIIEP